MYSPKKEVRLNRGEIQTKNLTTFKKGLVGFLAYWLGS